MVEFIKYFLVHLKYCMHCNGVTSNAKCNVKCIDYNMHWYIVMSNAK